MNTRVQSVPASLVTAIAVAAAVVIAALFMLTRLDGANSSSVQTLTGQGTSFGIGRDTFIVTPGVSVVATVQHPARIADADIRWTVSGVAAGTSFQSISGSGAVVRFSAPPQGSLLIQTRAATGGHTYTAETSVVINDADQVAASNVQTAGTVFINGTPAITGEALMNGTRVDATDGEITFLAQAKSTLSGLVSFSGSAFTVGTTGMHGGRRLTTIGVSQTNGSATKLHADVQHLDGVRYVAVQTPDAVAMVKGTSFDVSVDDNGSTVGVDHGLVLVLDRYRLYRAPVYTPTNAEVTIERVDAGDDANTWLDAISPGDELGGGVPFIADEDSSGTVGGDAADVIGDVMSDEVRYGDTPMTSVALPRPDRGVPMPPPDWCGHPGQVPCPPPPGSDGTPTINQAIACGQPGQPPCPGAGTTSPTGSTTQPAPTCGTSTTPPCPKPPADGSGGTGSTGGTTQPPPSCGTPTTPPCPKPPADGSSGTGSTGGTTQPPPSCGTPTTPPCPKPPADGSGGTGSTGGTTQPPPTCGTPTTRPCPRPPTNGGSTQPPPSCGTPTTPPCPKLSTAPPPPAPGTVNTTAVTSIRLAPAGA